MYLLCTKATPDYCLTHVIKKKIEIKFFVSISLVAREQTSVQLGNLKGERGECVEFVLVCLSLRNIPSNI